MHTLRQSCTTVLDTQLYVYYLLHFFRAIHTGSQITYSEKLLLDYRYMDDQGITPRFEFGFGLSYTTFTYSSLVITDSGTSCVVTFTVVNSGTLEGTEISQLYLAYPASAGEPKKVLRGFEEVELAVGGSVSVTITLSQREMRCVFNLCFSTLIVVFNWICSVWDTPSQLWVRPSGTFTAYVGASIKDIRLTGSF
jgi:beta-glucosidase